MADDEPHIDLLFSALADPIRRDIMERVYRAELTVNQIAVEYDMSLAAISKHLRILQEAGLINKRKQGRYQLVSAERTTLVEAVTYFDRFEHLYDTLSEGVH